METTRGEGDEMYFLGIDIGTGGSRAVLIDTSGTVVASAVADHPAFASPQIGWAEQDPEDWWRASVSVIGQVLNSSGLAARDIESVSFSGQMHGSVLLGADGEVLRPALLWCDQRTEKQCLEITDTIGAEHLIELVSNPAITGFTLPKLLWVRENEPDIWSRVRSILLPKDYVRFRLTGDRASDVADSSGTLLFDVSGRRWSSEMLDTFEIDADFLPIVYESIEITGKVSGAGAAATGLLEGTPVVAGAGDNAAGAIGMGIVKPGMLSSTIGTSGVAFAVTNRPTLDLKGRVHTLCHAIPDRWHLTGVTLAAGLSLKWFRENFGAGATFAELDREAVAIPPGSDGAIWLPYLMGERTPHMDPNARAAFVGLTANHTRGHLARAVMEGVAFSLREAIDIFSGMGVIVDDIRLGGGGAQSALWRQIQSDVFGRPAETIEADEGAAFGAAILAGVGAGAWQTVDEACEKAIRVADRVEPVRDSVEVLDRNYKIYKRIYPALRSAMDL
ncbi:xylulokinase [soil metagenome]